MWTRAKYCTPNEGALPRFEPIRGLTANRPVENEDDPVTARRTARKIEAAAASCSTAIASSASDASQNAESVAALKHSRAVWPITVRVAQVSDRT
jgi:hypothetical protein